MELKDGFYSFKKGLLSQICLLTPPEEWQEPGLVLSWSWITLWAQCEVPPEAGGWSRACFVGLGIAVPLMWFVPSSQGRRINLELTAHEFVIRAPVMQASLLPAWIQPGCLGVHLARLPAPGRGRGWDTGKCAGGSLEESRTTPVAQFLLPLCVPWLAAGT